MVGVLIAKQRKNETVMDKTEKSARKFAATKIKDKNIQPDNDIFFAAKEGFEKGVEWAEKNRKKAKTICFIDKTKTCNLCHECDVNVLNPRSY